MAASGRRPAEEPVDGREQQPADERRQQPEPQPADGLRREPEQESAKGPIVFAYDGSELAGLAIDEAGRLLGAGHDALVVCVWQPFDVGFLPRDGTSFNAAEIPEVRRAAQLTAEAGVERARAAGFRARPWTIESSPIWRGIVEVATEHDARLIVLGAHARHGLAALVSGSVAGAVAAHTQHNVLITHRPVAARQR